MIFPVTPPTRPPLPRRALLGLVPLGAAALAVATMGRPARAASTARAPECLADLTAA
ncbi:hypothetical protein KBX06_05235 [Micromonospora sp. C31]|uniref:hypothetical protein n=1 Tax=Micromonospora sp. C31 TaxID=2824876 RepID=UPI001B3821E5|nr:hypothetical protein [Micromonospora sp. C31]MBQ1072572.1 hypothetical protein [Micromonospora sp. C31]